ncbi:myo-inosose-2 dehydratase [Paenibacillus glycanilyticus]|uniref:Myo-inosose-2 dehydratase n=1 Tax=Paenibacillus glycanilyticus TaxID=126569 RepID=A0ABQ6G6E8_9BACL|nr:myo-inosose-2 dehydratase [Paenibacillus glycanilyticus]GLX66564.1 myo-inosose-2 dehydratase [Paenibacillus glycanilyticus]
MPVNRPFSVGIHPINWVGEDVREHGADTAYETILDDIHRLGLTGTEMGRKYPQDLEVLKQELSSRGIQLVSQWKSVLLSDPAYREQELAAYRAHCEFLSGMGSTVISTAEVGGSLHFDPRRTPNEKEVLRLDEEGWRSLAEGLNAAGSIAREYGMRLTYHHHGGTVVESPEEIDLLMELTDPSLVWLLYDTGHAYYGGADPLEVLRKHYDRIAYIHLKDIRPAVLDEARAEAADFVTCIRKGVFTVPGDGCIDFQPIVSELVERGYDGWAMLEGEQDPAEHPPYEYALHALQHIDALIERAERKGANVHE